MSDLSLHSDPAGSKPRRIEPFAWLERLSPAARTGLLVAAGALVFLPALTTGFLLDDFLHAAMLRGGFPVPRSPLDLYAFVDDSDRAALLQHGLLPWWTHEGLTIRFFRPLSSGLLWLDAQLFPSNAALGHLHSFLWWAAAVLAARALFRRTVPKRAAAMGTLIFALAPCHAMPLGWLANRDALLSLALGVLGLLAHLRWRERFDLRAGALATLLFGLSVFAGEYGLCVGGYVLAMELVRRREPADVRGGNRDRIAEPRRGPAVARADEAMPSIAEEDRAADGPRPAREARCDFRRAHLGPRALRMLTFAVPAAAYLAVRTALHYGSYGSGFYADPLRVPRIFAYFAPRRFAILLAEGWLALDPDTITWSSPTWAVLLGAAALAALIGFALRRALEDAPEKLRRDVAWLLIGSCISLLPVLAVVPTPRLLGASMLGVAPAIGLILDHAWFVSRESDRPPRRGAELFSWITIALAFAHLVHGPGTAFLMSRHYLGSSEQFALQVRSLRDRLSQDGLSIEEADVVVVRGGGAAHFTPFALSANGAPPHRYWVLAQTGHVLMLRRGPRTIELMTGSDASEVPVGEGNLFLDVASSVVEGRTYEASGMRATVVDMGEDRPHVVRYEFDRDLDELVWVHETKDGFLEATPPPIGFGRPLDPT